MKTIEKSTNPVLRRIDPAETASIREGLHQRENIQFVDRTEFSNLLISFRHLVRSNVAQARVHGLRDISSGIHYVIEEEKLFGPERNIPAAVSS